jgi:hypothetical protein
MITIEECKRILNNCEKEYDDEEIEKILVFLNELADIALQQYSSNNGKSYFIYSSID